MKRLFIIGLMLASAFALTNCAEEIAAPVQEDVNVDGNIENITPPEEEVDIPFEVFANVVESAETKTINYGNGTYWTKTNKDGSPDRISVVHHNGKGYNYNKPFTIADVETGKFTGGLTGTLGQTNDWYFIYPYNENYTVGSSSGTTISNVTIGAKVVNNVVPGSKTHISGDAYPMLGSIKGLGKETSPDIKMHHVAALVAIKIVNKTTGTIKIDDVGFGMPTIVSKDPLSGKKTIIDSTAILGSCKVNLTGENISTTLNESNVFSTTKACLKDTYNLKTEEEMIVYMAVSPVKTNGKTISIKVNGSQRTLKMTKDILNPGKVTTFKVEIKPFSKNATENLVSNAFDDKFTSNGEQGYTWKEEKTKVQVGTTPIIPLPIYEYHYTYTQQEPDNTHVGGKMVSLSQSNEIAGLKINGQSCSVAYKVGTTSTSGKITIQGWAKDILNALPLSFYASAMDNSPAAMTIHSVDLWIPEYNQAKRPHKIEESFSEIYTTEYHRLKTRIHLKDSKIGSLISLLSSVMDVAVTNDGLERKSLVNFVDENTITFNGIPTNGYFANDNIVVLREEDTHKSITPGLIDSFLKSKFSTTEYESSYLGLVAMVNADKSTTDGTLDYKAYIDDKGVEHSKEEMQSLATATANAIYNRILGVLNTKIDAVSTSSVFDGLGTRLLKIVFESPMDLIHKVRDMKFKVVIQTYPYAEQYPAESTAPYAPIVFWEMNGTK